MLIQHYLDRKHICHVVTSLHCAGAGWLSARGLHILVPAHSPNHPQTRVIKRALWRDWGSLFLAAGTSQPYLVWKSIIFVNTPHFFWHSLNIPRIGLGNKHWFSARWFDPESYHEMWGYLQYARGDGEVQRAPLYLCWSYICLARMLLTITKFQEPPHPHLDWSSAIPYGYLSKHFYHEGRLQSVLLFIFVVRLVSFYLFLLLGYCLDSMHRILIHNQIRIRSLLFTFRLGYFIIASRIQANFLFYPFNHRPNSGLPEYLSSQPWWLHVIYM